MNKFQFCVQGCGNGEKALTQLRSVSCKELTLRNGLRGSKVTTSRLAIFWWEFLEVNSHFLRVHSHFLRYARIS